MKTIFDTLKTWYSEYVFIIWCFWNLLVSLSFLLSVKWEFFMKVGVGIWVAACLFILPAVFELILVPIIRHLARK